MKIADRHLWQRFLAIAPLLARGRTMEGARPAAPAGRPAARPDPVRRPFIRQTAEFTSALAPVIRRASGRRFFYYLILLVVARFPSMRSTTSYATPGDPVAALADGRFLRGYFSHPGISAGSTPTQKSATPIMRVCRCIATFTQRCSASCSSSSARIVQMVLFSRVLWSISHELVYFLVFYATAGTLVHHPRLRQGADRAQLQPAAARGDSATASCVCVKTPNRSPSIAARCRSCSGVSRRFTGSVQQFQTADPASARLNFFQHAYNLLTIVVPSAIIAPARVVRRT